MDHGHVVHVPAGGVAIRGSCDLGPRPFAVPGRFKIKARIEVRVKLGLRRRARRREHLLGPHLALEHLVNLAHGSAGIGTYWEQSGLGLGRRFRSRDA